VRQASWDESLLRSAPYGDDELHDLTSHRQALSTVGSCEPDCLVVGFQPCVVAATNGVGDRPVKWCLVMNFTRGGLVTLYPLPGGGPH
jgi:hypothetical protein